MALEDVLPGRQRLSSKIIGALLTVLLLALAAISVTLLLSWQLEGSSAAINEAGGLRMHAYRASLQALLLQKEPENKALRFSLQQEIKQTDAVLALLQQGDPQRPLYLPSGDAIAEKFQAGRERWLRHIRPVLQKIASDTNVKDASLWQTMQEQVALMAAQVDQLNQLIEKDSEQRSAWLRSSQLALMALAVLGTIVLIYLMFLLIIQPVTRLQEGMQRMSERDFEVRLPVETDDEFGQVTAGFNEMGDKLAELYTSLERRVAEKTAELEGQNRELALLYDCASYLQQPQKVEQLCEGFLARIRNYFDADGGSVRVLDPIHSNVHMVVHHGISKDLVEAEHCLKVGDCLCGAAVSNKITVIHDLRKMDRKHELQCHKEGFSAVSVFQIQTHQQHLGFFNLHFREPKVFTKSEVVLLETLGQLLGVALENVRLATREREMAVSEERNLVAQGLHDSIAQGLTFMNIQVHTGARHYRSDVSGTRAKASGVRAKR
ncbi:MAG: type IV pili methyl-accepting chemotaxis transducer N-terminal domain-containing protein [Burkholderiales bacterium]|nr:type IV pili methyl-accepting chemotaxis transducer N-terminal domain-containing protein [Burkholderiales bacterium]